MARITLTLVDDSVVYAAAQTAYTAALETYGDHMAANSEAQAAAFRCYPETAFCVNAEKPIHKQIRTQVRNAVNAVTCQCHPR